jgi:hypothetical protein
MQSLILLSIEGSNRAVIVKLDDPSPDYAERYVGWVALFVDPAATVRFIRADVLSVAEYGPNDIATILAGDPEGEWTLDLSPEWEAVER